MDFSILPGGDNEVANPIRDIVGRAFREFQCHVHTSRSAGAPSVAFLPNEGPDNSLRAYAVSRKLEEFGFRTVCVPGNLSLAQRRRIIGYAQPDIVFVDKARNPLNRRELLFNVPYVLDLDDADFHDPRLRVAMEELAAGAAGVIAGSRYIAEWAVQWQSNVKVVWTGTPRLCHAAIPPSDRQPLVTWAQSDPLAYRKELDFVTEVMLMVLARRGNVKLRLYGWKPQYDRTSLGELNKPGIELDLLPPMPYSKFVSSLSDCAVGLSPIVPENEFSRGKSFGKILAYLDAQVPVVCSDEADHGLAFASGGAVVSNDPDVWVDAICCLLNEPDQRDRISGLGTTVLEEHLTIDVASKKVADFLVETIADHSSRHARKG